MGDLLAVGIGCIAITGDPNMCSFGVDHLLSSIAAAVVSWLCQMMVPNTNLFVMVDFMMEFPAQGAVFSSSVVCFFV